MYSGIGEIKIPRAPIHIIVLDEGQKLAYPIEIKYITKVTALFDMDENYLLANHGVMMLDDIVLEKISIEWKM